VLRSRKDPSTEVRDWAVWDRAWGDALAALADRPAPVAHRLAG
jgi:hypothetical protein